MRNLLQTLSMVRILNMGMLKRQMLNVNEIFSSYVEKGIMQFFFHFN